MSIKRLYTRANVTQGRLPDVMGEMNARASDQRTTYHKEQLIRRWRRLDNSRCEKFGAYISVQSKDGPGLHAIRWAQI